MASIFSKIIHREIPGYIIAEDDKHIAILDVFPLVKGHALVIPKVETDYYFDLPEDLLCSLNLFAQKISGAIKKTVPCKRIGVAIIGLEVPHVHIHLVPLNEMNDINFTRPKLKLAAEEMQETLKQIQAAL